MKSLLVLTLALSPVIYSPLSVADQNGGSVSELSVLYCANGVATSDGRMQSFTLAENFRPDRANDYFVRALDSEFNTTTFERTIYSNEESEAQLTLSADGGLAVIAGVDGKNSLSIDLAQLLVGQKADGVLYLGSQALNVTCTAWNLDNVRKFVIESTR